MVDETDSGKDENKQLPRKNLQQEAAAQVAARLEGKDVAEDKASDSAEHEAREKAKWDAGAVKDEAAAPQATETSSARPGAAPAASTARDAVDADASTEKESVTSTEKPEKTTTTGGDKSPPLLNNAVPPPPPPKASRWPVFLVFLIALGAAGGAGYTYWQFDTYRKTAQLDLKKSTEQVKTQASNESSRLSAELSGQISRELSQYQQRLSAQQQMVDQVLARVASANRRIGEITQVSRTSWMLAEAEYLLRLANQRLVIEGEVDSSLALLTAADQILLQVDDVNLFEVRSILAKEIAALRGVERLDVTGLFLQLAALSAQAAELELLIPEEDVPQAPKVETADDTPLAESALDALTSLVRIRQRDEAIKPLLTPEQHYYVQQNLRLMLEQAQLAVLQGQQELYTQSLDKAAQWVAEYFKLNAQANAVVDTLDQLKVLDIAPQLPDISTSLGLLKSYLSDPSRPLNVPQGASASQELSLRTKSAGTPL